MNIFMCSVNCFILDIVCEENASGKAFRFSYLASSGCISWGFSTCSSFCESSTAVFQETNCEMGVQFSVPLSLLLLQSAFDGRLYGS